MKGQKKILITQMTVSRQTEDDDGDSESVAESTLMTKTLTAMMTMTEFSVQM